MKILFIGPQGSGKSTQGKFLAQSLKIPYISTGDIFRNLAAQDNEASKRVKEFLTSGHLVDDETTSRIVAKRLQEDDAILGFILDGYPRTLRQIEIFDPGFEQVIFLDLKDDEAMKRLVKRGREDDTPDLIAKRLELYHQVTDPILEHYRAKGLLTTIDATLGIDVIQQQIKEAING